MSPIELLAAGLVLINIALVALRSVWNYPFALAAVTLYGFIFWDAKLYSDAGLQVFFFVVNLYGLWTWSANKAQAGTIAVQRLSPRAQVVWGVGAVAAIWGWGSLMAANTDASLPFWDASIAMLSVMGQILMTRRYIENWHYWIVVNLISVPLYWSRDLQLTAGVYLLSLGLALVGLIQWHKAEAQQA
jgi:nicotinamide mononucleotide transporter